VAEPPFFSLFNIDCHGLTRHVSVEAAATSQSGVEFGISQSVLQPGAAERDFTKGKGMEFAQQEFHRRGICMDII
jgi:hypothetical protein